MNVSNNGWKETISGHCRCCLEKGEHRDINKTYIENGKLENYSDMFLNCFNLFLTASTNVSTLICRSCVDQLRSAKAFKDMVQKSDQYYMEAFLSCYDQKVSVNGTTEHSSTTPAGNTIEKPSPALTDRRQTVVVRFAKGVKCGELMKTARVERGVIVLPVSVPENTVNSTNDSFTTEANDNTIETKPDISKICATNQDPYKDIVIAPHTAENVTISKFEAESEDYQEETAAELEIQTDLIECKQEINVTENESKTKQNKNKNSKQNNFQKDIEVKSTKFDKNQAVVFITNNSQLFHSNTTPIKSKITFTPVLKRLKTTYVTARKS